MKKPWKNFEKVWSTSLPTSCVLGNHSNTIIFEKIEFPFCERQCCGKKKKRKRAQRSFFGKGGEESEVKICNNHVKNIKSKPPITVVLFFFVLLFGVFTCQENLDAIGF